MDPLPPERSFMKRICLALLGLLPVLCLAGCSTGPKLATVSGKVTLQGTPVTGGTVIFHAPDGKTGTGSIKGDGTYIATEVPYGSLQVSVIPMPAMMAMSAPTKAPPGTPMIPASPTERRPMSLPPKYSKPESSGLTATVSKKEETYDIPLTK
jgi:hypothetical protein